MAKKHKDLKIPDGVKPGDPFVQILDPATGTGTFLVETIELIHKRMLEHWKNRTRPPTRSIDSGTSTCRAPAPDSMASS